MLDHPFRAQQDAFGSIPRMANRGPEALMIELASIPAAEFRDPFFIDTLERHPDAAATTVAIPRTRLAELGQLPAAAPSGIIFQISRCGSTALANILRSTGQCRVFSEPLAINDLLLPPHLDWSEAEVRGGLRWMAAAFQGAVGDQSWVLKLRSWNTLFAEELLAAFPRTPWVFLVRDPVEVAVSVLAKPPTWLREFRSDSNPFLPYLPVGVRPTSEEAYVAMVLGAFAKAIAPLDKRRGRLLHYEEFGAGLWLEVASHFGLPMPTGTQGAMAGEATLYSKDANRVRSFTNDTALKQLKATSSLRDAVREFAAQPFRELIENWNLR